MASSDFDPDGLVQAKRLIDELEAQTAGEHRVDLLDSRTLLRVLRILTDQIEELRCQT